MKKQPKKLSLHQETLKNLNHGMPSPLACSVPKTSPITICLTCSC
jgi:hypothetical protein